MDKIKNIFLLSNIKKGLQHVFFNYIAILNCISFMVILRVDTHQMHKAR